MAPKCCVPNCKSNYETNREPYVSVFSFPKDLEKRTKWLKSIHRESFVPSKHSVVCIKHFSESSVIKIDRMARDDGTILEVPRKNAKLTKDAIPTIFSDQDSYLTKKPPVKRKHPNKRRKRLTNRNKFGSVSHR